MSRPRLYHGITLLLANPEDRFPEDFDPEHPFDRTPMRNTSRESFIRSVERVGGAFVVRIEDFGPDALLEPPEDVELLDGATYIVVPLRRYSYEKRFEGVERWQRNQTEASERNLVDQAVKFLENRGHTNVRPFCSKKVSGPADLKKEIDAGAIADNCAVVIEHKNVMDADGAHQLTDLVSFIDSYKDEGEGSVSHYFSGKRIMGVLAGPCETNNADSKRKMDSILTKRGYLKWFEQAQYSNDPCSPFQALGPSCDAPNPTPNPGNGPTAPAALPRRVGRFLTPMRGSGMLVRPRLANRAAVRRLCF